MGALAPSSVHFFCGKGLPSFHNERVCFDKESISMSRPFDHNGVQ